jgi:hypothetical protein
LQSQRPQLPSRTHKRWARVGGGGRLRIAPAIAVGMPRWWQYQEAVPVQAQKRHPGGHLFETAVRLAPGQALADRAGNGIAGRILLRPGNEGADQPQLGRSNAGSRAPGPSGAVRWAHAPGQEAVQGLPSEGLTAGLSASFQKVPEVGQGVKLGFRHGGGDGLRPWQPPRRST